MTRGQKPKRNKLSQRAMDSSNNGLLSKQYFMLEKNDKNQRMRQLVHVSPLLQVRQSCVVKDTLFCFGGYFYHKGEEKSVKLGK